ncbi:MAG: hypothetical protein KJ070_00035 [Verrucomicrobia bacterium]|nr:hypothetical protein [Verrucomicrobiota bacterium]
MNTWKVILATLVIFAAGVVTGGLLVSQVGKTPPPGWQSPPPRPAEGPRRPGESGGVREAARLPGLPGAVPQFLRKEFLEKLDREVSLSPEQRERVEQIIHEGQERNGQLWERIAPELRKEIAETRRQIQAVLRPEQRARFDELMKQRPQRRTDEPNPPDRFRLRDSQYPALRETP